ncbi:transposase Tn3 [Deinococcus grandis]|uniref:Transposase Tn3 n=1 Tax=Deinococcus grandis TaxID=57498 RepID=A0A100HN57_9DEIO|nr:DUF4158 domain-containing protein [Deinococcus grandis]BBN96914.1 hypothetical protein DEGR_36470 [Deinococcus grandis]GAQ23803.1 transposase Tn3 [Deinococcus grandis]
MPVEFLSAEQAARYGRFAVDPTPEQLIRIPFVSLTDRNSTDLLTPRLEPASLPLAPLGLKDCANLSTGVRITRYFFLNEADLALIAERRRDHNKLGFAVQLCALRYLGTFLPNPIQVPRVVVQHVAQQLEVSPEVFLRYALREETRYTHRRDIVAYLGYREFDEFQVFRLIRWIYAHLAVSAVRPSVLFDLATAHLLAQKVVLPGVRVLERLIARVRERYTARSFLGLSRRLNSEQEQVLEQLLVLPTGKWQTPLEVLRTPPSRVGAMSLYHALYRVEQIRAVGVGEVDLSDVPAARQAALIRHALTARVQLIQRMSEERRLATLLVFLQHLERTATDDVLDIFDGLMTSFALRGEARRRRERLRSLKDLDQAALLLREATLMLLDSNLPAERARELALQKLGEQALREAAGKVAALASPDEDTHALALSGYYTTVRRFQRVFLQTITFTGTPTATPLLDALEFLKARDEPGQGKPRWSDAPRSVVPKSWERQVFPFGGQLDQQAYTLCVMDRLHQALKRREVFVERSERYGDPRAELLQGDAWLEARDDVCRALERSLDPRPELELLSIELENAFREVEE